MMEEKQSYVIQYVGFQTALDDETFLRAWQPFASSFKSAGIEQIDVYSLQNREILTYLSRNVWTSDAYLKNFPTGVPGGVRTQDVNVLQFGAYRLAEEQREAPETMTLLFQRSPMEVEEEAVFRARISEKVPFQQVVMLAGLHSDKASTNEQLVFPCSYLTSL